MLREDVVELLEREELYWKRKSIIQWLKEDDKK